MNHQKKVVMIMIINSEAFKSALSAIRERIAVSKRHGTHRGYIDYRGCISICRDFDDIITEAEELIDRGEYELCYAIAALILINCAKMASTADSSSGCLNDTIRYTQQLISKVCAAAKNHNEAAKYIFAKGLKDAADKAFDGWDDMAYDFLENLAVLSDADNIDKLYAVLDAMHEKLSKKEFSSYHLESDALVRLAAINSAFGESAADEFIATHLNFSGIRRMAVRRAIEKQDFRYAEKLCREILEKEQDTPSAYSRISEWRYLLFEIYDKAGDTENKIAAAKDLLFRFDTSYYAILKQLLTEKGVWEAEYPTLRLQLSQILPLHLYMEILSREGEMQMLLEKVREYPSSAFTYGKQLSEKYPVETYSICLDVIRRKAAEADNRIKYKKVCGSIKKLFEYGGLTEVDTVIVELKEKYPRRPAMLDELNSLSVKLAKKKK